MIKNIALATVFAAVSIVSFTSSASVSAANAAPKSGRAQAVAVPAVGGPVMQGLNCIGCR